MARSHAKCRPQKAAGSKQKGWKETGSDLKEKGWEAKRKWSESHELFPVKLCSCSSDRDSGHCWTCEIFMPAHALTPVGGSNSKPVATHAPELQRDPLPEVHDHKIH